ncbi:class I SAM-dependent methyltransferase [Microbacterium sp. NPDC079995]|uniref:class I SAM-dependent methyltransferase n=1 Tax=unclassified Microbacterium TaxID=2609290 RepID=UPI00344C53C4
MTTDQRHESADFEGMPNEAGFQTELSELRAITVSLVDHVEDLRAHVESLTAELREARRHTDEAESLMRRRVVREVGRARREIARVETAVAGVGRQGRKLGPELLTDLQALAQLMTRYQPSAPLPIVSGWAVSPAGLIYLTTAIEEGDLQLAVECGSGTSTLWMAYAMRQKGSGRVIALEHLPQFAEKTYNDLRAHGLEDWAEVLTVPLADTSTPRGTASWYDIDASALPGSIDLLLVDGPPATTGPHARYPALSVLAPSLALNCLIVADDTNRSDEKEMIEFWMSEHPDLAELPSPGRGLRVMKRSSKRAR